MEKEKTTTRLLWLDMEMTGLDEKTCHILEVAAVVTGWDLEPLETLEHVVFQPPEVVDSMDDWCKKTHGKSGLTAAIPSGLPLSKVEDELIGFTDRHFGKERVVLCGNSIHQDRKFVDLYLRRFAAKLHYRMIDVSSFKEVFRSKYQIKFEKKETHRAKEDIFESLAELRHYLSFIRT